MLLSYLKQEGYYWAGKWFLIETLMGYTGKL